MWAACTALLAALGCIVVSVKGYRRLLALEDGVAFCDRLGRGSLARLQLMRSSLFSGYTLELLNAVLEAPDQRAAVFGLNEVGSEIKFLLSGAHEVPRSAARIALGIGAVLAVLQLIHWLQGAPGGLAYGLICLGSGLSAGLTCGVVASRSALYAREQITAWSRAIRILGDTAEAHFGRTTC